ncbi:MAG TPA: zinc-dependent alcohol dehydrogenase family protein [Bacteroidota bacterium]
MKAALFEKPGHLSVRSLELRKLQPGELLVKVEACGVCGTDVHIVEGTSRSTPPVVLGHEYAGTVADAGQGSGPALVGTRVAVDPNVSCGTCYYCRRGLVHLCKNLRALGVDIDGGMAEFCIVPTPQAYTLPATMPPELCAFVEPVSCAVHGIDRAGIRAGDTLVVLGGGTIGLMMMQLARHAGAALLVVIEPLQAKRELARTLGAQMVLDPGSGDPVHQFLEQVPDGADVVLECVGRTSTMEQALRMARRGGTVEFFGVAPIGATIPLEPNMVYVRELNIVGSHVNPHTFDRAIAVLRSGVVRTEEFTVHRFPLDGVHDALAYQREGRTLKSVILPQE